MPPLAFKVIARALPTSKPARNCSVPPSKVRPPLAAPRAEVTVDGQRAAGDDRAAGEYVAGMEDERAGARLGERAGAVDLRGPIEGRRCAAVRRWSASSALSIASGAAVERGSLVRDCGRAGPPVPSIAARSSAVRRSVSAARAPIARDDSRARRLPLLAWPVQLRALTRAAFLCLKGRGALLQRRAFQLSTSTSLPV